MDHCVLRVIQEVLRLYTSQSPDESGVLKLPAKPPVKVLCDAMDALLKDLCRSSTRADAEVVLGFKDYSGEDALLLLSRFLTCVLHSVPGNTVCEREVSRTQVLLVTFSSLRKILTHWMHTESSDHVEGRGREIANAPQRECVDECMARTVQYRIPDCVLGWLSISHIPTTLQVAALEYLFTLSCLSVEALQPILVDWHLPKLCKILLRPLISESCASDGAVDKNLSSTLALLCYGFATLERLVHFSTATFVQHVGEFLIPLLIPHLSSIHAAAYDRLERNVPQNEDTVAAVAITLQHMLMCDPIIFQKSIQFQDWKIFARLLSQVLVRGRSECTYALVGLLDAAIVAESEASVQHRANREPLIPEDEISSLHEVLLACILDTTNNHSGHNRPILFLPRLALSSVHCLLSFSRYTARSQPMWIEAHSFSACTVALLRKSEASTKEVLQVSTVNNQDNSSEAEDFEILSPLYSLQKVLYIVAIGVLLVRNQAARYTVSSMCKLYREEMLSNVGPLLHHTYEDLCISTPQGKSIRKEMRLGSKNPWASVNHWEDMQRKGPTKSEWAQWVSQKSLHERSLVVRRYLSRIWNDEAQSTEIPDEDLRLETDASWVRDVLVNAWEVTLMGDYGNDILESPVSKGSIQRCSVSSLSQSPMPTREVTTSSFPCDSVFSRSISCTLEGDRVGIPYEILRFARRLAPSRHSLSPPSSQGSTSSTSAARSGTPHEDSSRSRSSSVTLKKTPVWVLTPHVASHHPSAILSVMHDESIQRKNPWSKRLVDVYSPHSSMGNTWTQLDMRPHDFVHVFISYDQLEVNSVRVRGVNRLKRHLTYLRAQESTCPIKDRTRRAMLHDLLHNVYPPIVIATEKLATLLETYGVERIRSTLREWNCALKQSGTDSLELEYGITSSNVSDVVSYLMTNLMVEQSSERIRTLGCTRSITHSTTQSSGGSGSAS